MSEYTTITIQKSLKAELSEDMADQETWNEYLHRLRAGGTESPADHGTQQSTEQLSDDALAEIQATVRNVAADVDSGEEPHAPAPAEDHAIDYDHIREIVREEVRRALEDVVR